MKKLIFGFATIILAGSPLLQLSRDQFSKAQLIAFGAPTHPQMIDRSIAFGAPTHPQMIDRSIAFGAPTHPQMVDHSIVFRAAKRAATNRPAIS
jgi:hypothetical protein